MTYHRPEGTSPSCSHQQAVRIHLEAGKEKENPEVQAGKGWTRGSLRTGRWLDQEAATAGVRMR